MIRALVLAVLLGGCTALGLTPPNLTVDCDAQASVIQSGLPLMPKLLIAERTSIDAQLLQSKGYCQGTIPADQTAASKAVEASTAQISATLAIAAVRK